MAGFGDLTLEQCVGGRTTMEAQSSLPVLSGAYHFLELLIN